MSLFDEDNKNSKFLTNLKKISLENAFLGKNLNRFTNVKSINFRRKIKPLPFTSDLKSFLKSNLNGRLSTHSNTLKTNNTSNQTHFSDTKEADKSNVSTKSQAQAVPNGKYENEDIQEKFDRYLKKLTKITPIFKTFKEKTQDLSNDLSGSQKDNKVTTFRNYFENSNFYNSKTNSLTNSYNHDTNPVLEDKIINNNPPFTFKDRKDDHEVLYNKQVKILKTIDLEPIVVKNETKENLNSETDVEDKFIKQDSDNKVLESLENIIEIKLNLIISRFLPYFNSINTELKQIVDKLNNNSNYLINTIEVKLRQLENNILNLIKTTDINSLELETLHDTLKVDIINSLLNSVKALGEDINNLSLKQEDEHHKRNTLLNKIDNLETELNTTIKSHTEEIQNKLNKLQSSIVSTSESNKNELLSKIKGISKVFNDSPDIMVVLEKSISNVRLKQDDLLKHAITIKEQLLNNDKEISSIKDTNKEHNKIVELVKDLQNNQKTVEEQNVLNEKIHRDMEIIKKNIFRLIQEQNSQKFNNLSNNSKESKKIINDSLHSNHKHVNSIDNNSYIEKEKTDDKRNKLYSNEKYNIVNDIGNNNKNYSKSSKVDEALLKIKEALDVEDGLPEESISKENIDSIIKNVKNDSKSASENNYYSTSNTKNLNNEITDKSSKKQTPNVGNEFIQKDNQKKRKSSYNNIFVLDNSKFFK